ncbi:hypothetical protein HUK74_10275 [Pseudomonas aeruginosa]|nr:hypothetical protein HUK74_10275 [Pseudomonas aeruginosa]
MRWADFIADEFGGIQLVLPWDYSLKTAHLHVELLREFDGSNVQALAEKYQLPVDEIQRSLDRYRNLPLRASHELPNFAPRCPSRTARERFINALAAPSAAFPMHRYTTWHGFIAQESLRAFLRSSPFPPPPIQKEASSHVLCHSAGRRVLHPHPRQTQRTDPALTLGQLRQRWRSRWSKAGLLPERCQRQGVGGSGNRTAATVQGQLGDNEGDTPAAGWFKQLVWRADGLYVLDLVLAKRGVSAVVNDEYRYFSPVFYADTNIPRQLIGLLITNDPSLRSRKYG